MPLRMPQCTISYGSAFKGVVGDIEGMVTSIGASPRASVRVFQRDPEAQRMRAFDRLIDAKIDIDKRSGVAKITGRSEKLVLEQIGSDDGETTITVTPMKGCRGCQ